MTTLTEFLLARFADLEADVRNRKTYAVGHSERCIFEGGYEGSGSCDCGAVDRVLADVAAKRAIVEQATGQHTSSAEGYDILCILATIWADHPSFDESWRP